MDLPVGATAGPVDATAGPVDATAGPVDATASPVDATAGPVDATADPVDATAGPVEAIPGTAEATSGPVEDSAGQVEATDGTTGPVERVGADTAVTAADGRCAVVSSCSQASSSEACAPSRRRVGTDKVSLAVRWAVVKSLSHASSSEEIVSSAIGKEIGINFEGLGMTIRVERCVGTRFHRPRRKTV